MTAEEFDYKMREILGSTAAVDPDDFREACDDLSVWEDGVSAMLFEHMCDVFEDDAISATFRFLDLGISLHDGTLAEFMASTDEGNVAVPYAIYEAAAVVPLDDETNLLDRPAWFREIMRRLSRTEAA